MCFSSLPIRTGPSDSSWLTAMLKRLETIFEHRNDLVQMCMEINRALPPIKPRTDLSIVTLNAVVDKHSIDLPIQVPGLFKLAIMVEPDGNCMPRCGSLIGYGSENFHTEIRLRMFLELVLHEQLYLDDDHISKAAPLSSVMSVTTMSDHYDPSVEICDQAVATVFWAEVRDTLKQGTSCSLWHLMAMASILKVVIMSVHPSIGCNQRQEQLHRLIYPREPPEAPCVPIFVMWTSTRTDMNWDHWVPNHVTLCLPMLEESNESTVDLHG